MEISVSTDETKEQGKNICIDNLIINGHLIAAEGVFLRGRCQSVKEHVPSEQKQANNGFAASRFRRAFQVCFSRNILDRKNK